MECRITLTANRGRILSVEHLLIIQHLLRHPEIDTASVARIAQQSETDARETLSRMETDFGYVERGGAGRGTYWTLRHDLHGRLSVPGHPERDRRIDWEAAKTRVLSVLKRRAEKDPSGLQNSEVRKITHFDRQQVNRMIHELEEEGQVRIEGHGRGARYHYVGKKKS